jgi:HEAT repeat protein
MSNKVRIQELIAVLRTGNLEGRRTAVRELAAFGAEAAEPLAFALGEEEEDNDVRWYIGQALIRIGEPAVPPLIEVIGLVHDHDARRYAAAALGEIGEPAVQPLIELLTSDREDVRGFAALALCRVGKPAVEPLLLLMDTSSGVVHSCAALTLWKMGELGPQALQEYFKKTKND